MPRARPVSTAAPRWLGRWWKSWAATSAAMAAACASRWVKTLVQLVEGGQLGAQERVAAAHTLGRLGDPRPLTPEQPGYWCDVAAGQFWFGDDTDEDTPLTQVDLPEPFKIGRYLVTNAAYAAFLAAQGGAYDPEHPCWTENGRAYVQQENRSQPSWWDDPTAHAATLPVIGVSWYEAAAYCRWLTAQGHAQGWLPADQVVRLPTSLEWERAARGTDKRRFPWGDTEPTPEHANYDATGIGQTSPVGSFPLGRGARCVEDMAGNVGEWLATPYQQDMQASPAEDFTTDRRILMTWSNYGNSDIAYLCCGIRDWGVPADRYDVSGFRVLQSRART